jgi:hypothetical protein
MGYRVDIDHRRSRTIVREIGERLDGSLKPEPELPEGLKKQIDRLRELEEQSPLIIPAAERWDKVRRWAKDGSAEHGWAMPSVKRRASKILNEYGEAQAELIGKAVVLTDGKAGAVEQVWLDELHGLRISIKGHYGRWPVSTIKFIEN